MKRVIEGRVYNTETADHICDLPCSNYPGDFSYHDTSLYRTKKGAYFLAGEGGAMSMWAKPAGQNQWGGGKGIRVLSKEEAREHAENAELDPDEMMAAGFDIEEA